MSEAKGSYLDSEAGSSATAPEVVAYLRYLRDHGSPPDGGCPCCGNWPDECVTRVPGEET